MTKDTLTRLAHGIHAGFPSLDEPDARLALTVHRLLARGAPVAVDEAAGPAGLSMSQALSRLEAWPGVFWNDAGRVIGFWGLALGETPHRIEVAGNELYAWCAWDALFLPAILDRPAHLVSRCPVSGGEISLSVRPDGVDELAPTDAQLSMVDASGWSGLPGNRVVSACCHHIHFFLSRSHGEAWLDRQDRDDLLLLSVEEGFELGRKTNELRYGGLLHTAPRPVREPVR